MIIQSVITPIAFILLSMKLSSQSKMTQFGMIQNEYKDG